MPMGELEAAMMLSILLGTLSAGLLARFGFKQRIVVALTVPLATALFSVAAFFLIVAAYVRLRH